MLADVGQAKRLRVADQLAQDAGAAGKLADRAPCGLVDAGGQEAFELLTLLIEDPDGRVARSVSSRPAESTRCSTASLASSATIDVPTSRSRRGRCSSSARPFMGTTDDGTGPGRGVEPREIRAELLRDDLLIGGPGRRVEHLRLEAPGSDWMRAHEHGIRPVSSFPRITGLNAAAFVCTPASTAIAAAAASAICAPSPPCLIG